MRQRHRSKELIKGTRRHGSFRFAFDKFLFSKVGQCWDKVKSQLSQEFKRGTYAGDKFWWLMDFNVTESCWIGAETRNVYDSQGMRVFGFYSHPFTGILSYIPGNKWEWRYGRDKEEKEITRITLDSKRAYEKIEGIWYYTEFRKNDYYLGYRIQSPLFPDKPYIVVSKRQLSHRELQNHGLINDNPEERAEAKIKADEAFKAAKHALRPTAGPSPD